LPEFIQRTRRFQENDSAPSSRLSVRRPRRIHHLVNRDRSDNRSRASDDLGSGLSTGLSGLYNYIPDAAEHAYAIAWKAGYGW
jgi:hypothetical protein